MKILKRGLNPEQMEGLVGGFVGDQVDVGFSGGHNGFVHTGYWVHDNETGEKVACYNDKQTAEIADAHYHSPETRGEILNHVQWQLPNGYWTGGVRWPINPDGSAIYKTTRYGFGLDD